MAKINAAAMKIDEFINTYSDDLITIHEARAAAYTHPLRGDYALTDSLLDASFCRIPPAEIAAHIGLTVRATQHRLAKLSERGFFVAMGSEPNDPRCKWGWPGGPTKRRDPAQWPGLAVSICPKATGLQGYLLIGISAEWRRYPYQSR
jgi:hypothetical protein